MPSVDRRRFLQLTGGAVAASVLTESVARAAAIPASRRHGSLKDVEHIVVLMQENRSFDHYFGTMRGVRGFGDPHPATLPSGRSVWHQSDGTREVLPFRPDHDDLGLAFVQDLAHGWKDGHDAFHDGRYDGWIPAKTATTMAHMTRGDMPFLYALADSFTVCDSYHCSFIGSTDPNRYYMWTGWTGNDGTDPASSGPVIDNSEAGYTWTTYPERLEKAGVSWKIYQDTGIGLDADGGWGWTDDPYIGNYGDNSLLYFDTYRNAKPGDPLYDKARTGTSATNGDDFFEILTADVKAGRLPKISWIAAPEAFTEHPNWPVNYGAWYVSKVLDALTSNPDVWSKTALFITYDENDGFFDHVVPPYANRPGLPGASTVPTTHEIYSGPNGVTGPYGLGQRVPMIVVSPWSSGGWVCSETFDHTSIIRFMEKRFGVREPHITPWRRAVTGDLTSAFDFGRTRTRTPALPSTAGYYPPDHERHEDYKPVPPAKGRLPRQEPGVRPSRPLGYRFDVRGAVTKSGLELAVSNRGKLGVHLQARAGDTTPASYTVGAGHRLDATVPIEDRYEVELHGPNGFFRRFAGHVKRRDLEARLRIRGDEAELEIVNDGSTSVTVEVVDAYAPRARRVRVGARSRAVLRVQTARRRGWYDLTVQVPSDPHFRRTLAGRVETGAVSISDPQLG